MRCLLAELGCLCVDTWNTAHLHACTLTSASVGRKIDDGSGTDESTLQYSILLVVVLAISKPLSTVELELGPHKGVLRCATLLSVLLSALLLPFLRWTLQPAMVW